VSRHYLEERNCDALNCRRRTELRRVKSFIPGLLVHLWLCKEHADEHDAAIHEKFREEFGLDFVDAARQ
jgi:predicted nucleic acid-binding protein